LGDQKARHALISQVENLAREVNFTVGNVQAAGEEARQCRGKWKKQKRIVPAQRGASLKPLSAGNTLGTDRGFEPLGPAPLPRSRQKRKARVGFTMRAYGPSVPSASEG